MRVRCISATSLGGGRDLYPGDVLDLEEAIALRLVAKGIVIPHTGAPAPSSKAGDEESMREAGDELDTPPAPEPEHREPRMRRKG